MARHPLRTGSLLAFATLLGLVAPAAAQPARDRTFALRESFDREVRDRCQYEVEVRGRVRERRPAGGDADQARYTPALRVRAELACPDGPPTVVERQVVGGTMSRRRLLAALEGAARVVTATTEGGACVLRPVLELDGRDLDGRAVVDSCAAPTAGRGGGPRAERARRRERAQRPLSHPRGPLYIDVDRNPADLWQQSTARDPGR